MRTVNSLANRLIALALSVVMVLGMFPTGIVAAENASYGTVESLTEGITITGSGANIDATFAGTLDWVAANAEIGRVNDGWWAGIKVTAPETLNLESAQYTSGGTAKSFNANKDSADDAQTHYITLWGLINEEYLRTANLTDGLATYTYTFDWDGDGTFEQKVLLQYDADQIVLRDSTGTSVYPAQSYGYGHLDMLTSGATITGNDSASIGIAYDAETVVDWVAADPSIGRYQDGWWAGMKITVPSGMTEEQVKNAQYMSRDTVKSFWEFKDSAEGAAAHFMTMWVPLNNLISGTMTPYTYQFDWNNDGIFEQKVVMTADSAKVILTKGGVQVYPVLGKVSSYTGGTVTGSETGSVAVLINDVELNWSPADASIGRTKGWWVGIKVEAPAGMDASVLQNAVYQSKSGPSSDWSANKSFWSMKDSADSAENHYIGLWFPVSPASLEKFKNENRNITMWYQFDWDNDGDYEQAITFSVDPNGNIVLNKVNQTGFAFAEETPADIWIADGTYENTASGGQGDGAITYAIIEGDAAAVDPDTGKVTFSKPGTVKVQATKAADSEGYYNAATAQYTITAVKKDQEPKFQISDPGDITYSVGATFENAVTNVLGGTVTYEIAEGDAATIDSATGKLTILKGGEITVKAVVSGDDKYNATEVTYTLKVNKADQPDFALSNAPAELTWQKDALEAIAVVGGLSEGNVTWKITFGEDVATVDENGKITLLKAGTFTVQAQKNGDDRYNASSPVSATILVNKANQTDFGFGETETVDVTYNDNNNKYTLKAEGGQSTGKIQYTVISGDAASVDEETGEVTVQKAGSVTIQAVKAADSQYNAASDTYVLNIAADTQTFGFEKGAEVTAYYGTKEFSNPVKFDDNYSQSSSLIYTISENEIGAKIDASTGVITFTDSEAKVGSLEVTATKAADDCYSIATATYKLKVEYLPADKLPTATGDKKNDSVWFTGNVKIEAPEGYTISKYNELSTADWSESVPFEEEGAEKTAEVYLKNSEGYITDKISVESIFTDTGAPTELSITYTEPTWQVVLENVTFGLYQSDKLDVTVSAKDSNSGIASLTYNVGGQDVTVSVTGTASASHTFSIDAQFRNKVTLTATDVAGNQSKLENDIVVVLDTKNPQITAAYAFESNSYREKDDIIYTQKDTTVTFTLDESNFDLSGLAIQGKDGEYTGVPVVTVNGEEKTVTWTKVENTTTWQGTLTLSGNGDYVVGVTFTDPANNEMDPFTKEIHIDSETPIVSVDFDNNTARNEKFYKDPRTAKIEITDHNFNAAGVELVVEAKNILGKTVEVFDYAQYAKDPANWTNVDNLWTLNTEKMVFSEDAVYKVTLDYVNLNETAAETNTTEFVVDKNPATDVTITYSKSIVDKVLELATFGFYQGDVTVKVQAKDLTAGVESFQIAYNAVNGANNSNKESYTTEELTAVPDPENANVFTASHTISANARGTVSVTVLDKAGNEKIESDNKHLVVDKVKPELKVEYSFTKGQYKEYKNELYTQSDTKVKFTVTEANFDLTLKTAEGETANKAPAVSVNGTAQDVQWTQIPGTDNWEGEITLTGYGDYQVKMTFADRSTNEMNEYVKVVHIDDKEPQILVSYDNNNARNTDKYKADRTATVQIEEHNFNADDVALVVTAQDITGAKVDIAAKEYEAYAKNPDNWTNVGDLWTLNTAGMKFDIDAIYTVDVTYADLAENDAEAYRAEFVIDKTKADNIQITYSKNILQMMVEKVTFGIYQAEVEVTVTAQDMTAGVEFFTLTYTKEEGASATNTDTFTAEPLKANQDASKKNVFTASYKIPAAARGTVSVLVMDQAGNESTQASAVVLVVDKLAPTREVIFEPYKVLDKATMTEVDSYKEGDDSILYYKDKAVVTFKITEANFDLSLQKDEYKPVIKVNDDPVSVNWTQDGDVWTATHTISGDGDYYVTMSYKDLSTNEMVDYKSCKIAIDSNKPVVLVEYADGKPTQTLGATKYYKTTQTVEVQITEHNFRADDVVVTVTAKDVQGNPVDISLKAYQEYARNRANWVSVGDVHTLNTAGMAMDIDAIYTFDIAYSDICDNPMVRYEDGKLVEGYEEDSFVVDHAAPANLQIDYSSSVIEKVMEALTFGFYQADVTVTLTADDVTSGVDFFEWTYTKQDGVSETNAEDTGATIKTGEITYSNNGKTATAKFSIAPNARGHVTATVTDRAGNVAKKNDSGKIIVVDNVAPSVSVSYETLSADTKVQYLDAANATVDSFEKAANALYNGNVAAKIVINEANFFEGIAAADGVIHQIGIKLTKTDDDGNQTVVEYLPAGAVQKYAGAKAEYISWNSNGDEHSFVINYADNADYVLQIEYADLSANDAEISANDGLKTAKVYTSKKVTVDKIAPVITVAYGNTDVVNTIGERKYFDAVQSAVITVTEHNFRASDIKAVVEAVDVNGAKVAVADYAALLADEKNWTHEGNVHTAKIAYSVDANYTFDIDFLDLAQNASADYTADKFTVDTTAPTNLTVSYSTNVFDEILNNILFGYYNATMTVTITAHDATSGIYHFDYSYINSEGVSGVNAELLDQAIAEADITFENGTATATFNIPKMVLKNDNQFNGTVEFTAYDRSENSTDLTDSQRIVVDNISPVANITYNDPVQTVNDISYYDGNIHATIEINEANFDAHDVQVNVTKDGENYPVNIQWVDNSVDVHTGTFTLTEDGDYIVSIQYRDNSQNQMVPYTSNQLTLDTTAPEIRVSDIVANSANKDDKYGFQITFEDINIDLNSMNPVLQAVVQNEAGVYTVTNIDLGKPVAVTEGKTYTYTVENLPDDALYTLTCDVQDMSGNATNTVVLDDNKAYGTVQFSINRNGSAFGFGNEFTEKLVGQYYVYSVNEDVVILEVNVDPIENYVVKLNGKDLAEGADYTTEQSSNPGEWSKRTYTINKDLFASEGEYSIIVTSTDKAETTAYSDVKNLAIAFVVDQTAPVITISGLANGGRYQTDEQTVTLIPTDEGGRLNKLSVVVLDSDGKPLTDEAGKDISVRFELEGEELLTYLEENDGKVIFTIPEGLNNQVQIICNDCAVNAEGKTNEYNETFTKVTVSQSQLVIFYANKPLFYGSIGGVAGITGVIIALLKRKKEKKTKV